MYSDARTHMHASADVNTQIHADRVNMHSESSNYAMQTVNVVFWQYSVFYLVQSNVMKRPKPSIG